MTPLTHLSCHFLHLFTCFLAFSLGIPANLGGGGTRTKHGEPEPEAAAGGKETEGLPASRYRAPQWETWRTLGRAKAVRGGRTTLTRFGSGQPRGVGVGEEAGRREAAPRLQPVPCRTAGEKTSAGAGQFGAAQHGTHNMARRGESGRGGRGRGFRGRGRRGAGAGAQVAGAGGGGRGHPAAISLCHGSRLLATAPSPAASRGSRAPPAAAAAHAAAPPGRGARCRGRPRGGKDAAW